MDVEATYAMGTPGVIRGEGCRTLQHPLRAERPGWTSADQPAFLERRSLTLRAGAPQRRLADCRLRYLSWLSLLPRRLNPMFAGRLSRSD